MTEKYCLLHQALGITTRTRQALERLCCFALWMMRDWQQTQRSRTLVLFICSMYIIRAILVRCRATPCCAGLYYATRCHATLVHSYTVLLYASDTLPRRHAGQAVPIVPAAYRIATFQLFSTFRLPLQFQPQQLADIVITESLLPINPDQPRSIIRLTNQTIATYSLTLLFYSVKTSLPTDQLSHLPLLSITPRNIKICQPTNQHINQPTNQSTVQPITCGGGSINNLSPSTSNRRRSR